MECCTLLESKGSKKEEESVGAFKSAVVFLLTETDVVMPAAAFQKASFQIYLLRAWLFHFKTTS